MSEFYAGAVKAKIIFDDAQFTQTAEKVSKKTESFGNSGKKAGKIFKQGVAIAAEGLRASAEAADDFTKRFANVSTLVDPVTVDLQKMQKDLLGLDSRLGSAADLTDGLYQALSASVEPAKAVEFVGEAAKFAKAGLTSTNKAVDVITTSLNAYGLEADQAGRMSDVLFETIRKGKTTGDQLARSIGKSIPLAANAGVTFEELGATIAVLTRQGSSTAESTTQVNAAISSLIKPSTAASNALEELGYSSAEALIKQNGLVGGMKALIGTTDGSNESMAALFPNIRALRGAMSLTGEGAKDFDEVLQSMKDSSGATEEAFEKQELTFDTLDNALNKLSITLGQELLPFIYSVAESFTDFIDGISKSGELTNFLSVTMSYLSASFEVFKTAIGPIVDTILGVLSEEFGEVSETIEGASGEASTAKGPFIALAKGLNVLTGVATTLIKGFSLVAKAIVNVVDIAGKAGKVMQEIGKFITFQESDVGGAFEELGGSISNTFDTLVNDYTDMAGSALNTITSIFDDVSDQAEKYEDSFNSGLQNTTDNLNKHSEAARNAAEAQADLLKTGNASGEMLKANAELLRKSAEITAHYSQKTDLSTQSSLKQKEAEKKKREELKAYRDILIDLKDKALDLRDSALKSLTSGLTEVGIALGSGGDAANSFGDAIEKVAMEILEALPLLLLQAGISLLPTNLPMGLALIAAAGLAALGAGAVIGSLGVDEKATGGVAKGPTLVGEEGPEIVNFKSPSMVVPNDKTNELMGGSMNFYFTGPINSEIDLRKAGEFLGRELQSKRTVIQ